MTARPFVVIAVPTRGTFASEMACSVFDMACRLQADLQMHTVTTSLLPTSRAILVEVFMRTRASHLLFVDDDSVFKTETIAQMLDADVDFVAALFPRKQLDHAAMRVAAMTDDPNWHEAGTQWNLCSPPLGTQRSGLLRVERVGLGLAMLKRRTIERLLDSYADLRFPLRPAPTPVPELGQIAEVTHLFHPLVSRSDGPLGEDISFCARWTDIGGEIHAVVDAEVEHIGLYSYGGNYARELERARSQ